MYKVCLFLMLCLWALGTDPRSIQFHTLPPQVRNPITHTKASWQFARTATSPCGMLWGIEPRQHRGTWPDLHPFSCALYLEKQQSGELRPTSPKVGVKQLGGQFRNSEVSPPANLCPVQNNKVILEKVNCLLGNIYLSQLKVQTPKLNC